MSKYFVKKQYIFRKGKERNSADLPDLIWADQVGQEFCFWIPNASMRKVAANASMRKVADRW